MKLKKNGGRGGDQQQGRLGEVLSQEVISPKLRTWFADLQAHHVQDRFQKEERYQSADVGGDAR